jgi:L,D-transpeptidase catalytic domain
MRIKPAARIIVRQQSRLDKKTKESMMKLFARLAFIAASFAGLVGLAGAEHFTEGKQVPPSTAKLRPGDFVWEPERAPSGPVLIVVSQPEQVAYVYRNGIRIARSSVSTGRPGHPTPVGVFDILEKEKDHESTIYKGAEMPWMERLTWSGIALHAGNLPGYPDSHGCVRLPLEFSKLLYTVTTQGGTVIIADATSAPRETVHPGMIYSQLTPPSADAPLSAGEFSWTPDQATHGPVTILFSAADKQAYVYRNGVEIGRAKIAIRDPEIPFGMRAYTMIDSDPSSPTRWMSVKIPGHMGETRQPLDPEQRARVAIPPAFLSDLRQILAPGATLAVTDASVLEQTTGVPVKVLDDEPPDAQPAQ